MKLRIGIFLVFVSTLAFAQDGASLRVLPVSGIRDGSTVISYDILVTEAVNRLVVEARDPEGVVGFYTFDHVEGALVGRVGAAAAVPVQFRVPEISGPSSRAIPGIPESDRYREVGSAHSPVSNDQFVTAVPLAERRFADVTTALHEELPPVGAGLAVEYVVVTAEGTVESRCVIEPNMIRIGERVTAVSAEWILAHGRPHLLVGLAGDAGREPWPIFYRLYSPDMELVSQSVPVVMADPNRSPQPVLADITGDGADEIIVFSNSGAGPAVAVLQSGPGDRNGNRILALNDCPERMNGPDVVRLQRRLVHLGYQVGRHGIDGWYGPDTRAAVVDFQRDEDVPVTGVVDDLTWNRLGLR